jgi:hypothetical protein
MADYGKNRKKIVFYDDDHTHAQLRIKFIADGIKQATFFKDLIRAYIDDDPNIRAWINANPNCKISKRSMKLRLKEDKQIQEEKSNLNLDEKEVNEIFDILAEEDKEP